MVDIIVEGQKLDLFKDESIQVTDSIQDVKDIAKIFTTYTQQFTVPASKINNEIFKHYYNFEITNGYDARIKKECQILIDGFVKFDGYLQLNAVSLVENKPKDYKVYFVGSTSKIKEILKDAMLSDLESLNEFDHAYNDTNIRTGLQTELFDGAIKYPFISAEARLVESGGEVRRIDNDGNITTQTAIINEDFKPALQVIKIIEAIDDAYEDINFDYSFFGKDLFKDLYLWLHRGKGRAVVNFAKQQIDRTNLVGTGNLLTYPVDGIFRIVEDRQNINPVIPAPVNDIQTYDEITLDYTITVDGDFEYEIIDLLSDVVYASGSGTDAASESVSLVLSLQGSYKPVMVVTTNDDTATSIQGDLDITCKDFYRDEVDNQTITRTSSWTESFATVTNYIIQDQIPNMKILDFLTSLFKMFNLTASVNKDNIIEVLPLDTYYSQGREWDITNQVQIDKAEVSRIDTFNEISFKFAEDKTFYRKAFTNENGRVYGDLTYNITEDLADVNSLASMRPYEIQLGFEKMLFVNLLNSTGVSQDVLHGAAVNENNEATSIKPLLLFIKNKTKSLTFENSDGSSSTVTTINQPTNQRQLSTNVAETINFGAELFGENTLSDTKSLFNIYYENFIKANFNPRSRLLKIAARLSNDFLLNYSLNDKLLIGTKQYRINKIATNLNTRISKLELVNDLIKIKTLEVSPAQSSFNDDANTQVYTVTSNVVWNVDSVPSWATITGGSGVNNGSFTLDIDANATNEERSFDLIVSGEGVNFIIPITQVGKFISVRPIIKEFGQASDSQVFTVESNVSWTVSNLPAWLSASPTSGTNNGSFTLTALANPSATERDATILVSGSGILFNIPIFQDGEVLEINPQSKQVSPSSNTYDILVTSNISWSVVSNQSWATLSASSGTGNGIITVTVDPNSGSRRTADITFTGGAQTQIHDLTQQAFGL